MKFTIYDELYAINVAKVREIMMCQPTKPMPHAHAAVEGIFKPRDMVFTAVDLPFYLTGKESEPQEKDLFMVTNFNQMHIAFRVHSVVGIQRLSWKEIRKPDKTLVRGEESVATGIAEANGELVIILDFEKIVGDIALATSLRAELVDNVEERKKRSGRVFIAEDSVMLSKLILDALHKAGYHDTKQFNNGQELWDYLCAEKEEADLPELVITDIEMPQMDGHRLTKLIKTHADYKHLPVLIFSSLINEEMRRKGKEVGANEQLSKPEIGRLIHLMDDLLSPR